MTRSHDTKFAPSHLLWVGVIAFVAAFLIWWFNTESLAQTALMGTLSAAISIAIVWFVGWTRRAH
jgi:hypothetical protein